MSQHNALSFSCLSIFILVKSSAFLDSLFCSNPKNSGLVSVNGPSYCYSLKHKKAKNLLGTLKGITCLAMKFNPISIK